MSDKVKLVMIIDPSEAFLRNKALEVFNDWNIENSQLIDIEEWTPISSEITMFGEVIIAHLDLSEKKNLKSFADLISDRKTKKLFDDNGWQGNGVIITSKTPQGSKKIENLVERTGGQVIKKEAPQKRKKQILDELNLSKNVKLVVDSFVGEDYEMLLGFSNEIKDWDKKKQLAITEEEALTMFPPKAGSVLPWEYLNLLMDGKVAESISMYERTVEHTHPLVPFTFLYKKMSLLLRVKGALMEGIWDTKEISSAIGERNGPEIWNVTKLAKKLNINQILKINKIVAQLESDLKGGSVVDDELLFRNALIHIGFILG